MSNQIDKKILEIYNLGKAQYASNADWEKLLTYETLQLNELDKVFVLVMDLLGFIGITDGEVNSTGALIEDGIDIVNRRRFALQKQNS